MNHALQIADEDPQETTEWLELVADLSDDDIWALARGGHDPDKVYAAYAQAARNSHGGPTAILVKTVKGFGMGEAGEGQNINHQLKKMSADAVRAFRDRFQLPVSDEQLEALPYLRPEPGSPEAVYLQQRRAALGGFVPSRRTSVPALAVPALDSFAAQLKGTGDLLLDCSRHGLQQSRCAHDSALLTPPSPMSWP